MSFTTLVSIEQLAAHPEWRVFDCRHELSSPQAGPLAYAQSHIPGALHANVDLDLSSAKTGRNGRHPLPDPAAFADWLGRCGVLGADQVVAYDGADGAFAARLWWLLRSVGHEAVAVLDGGLARWRAGGHPETDVVPTFPATTFMARPKSGLTVDAESVEANLRDKAFTVVDARGSNRYQGRDETIDAVGGHIPGALSRPYSGNLADGRFKPADLLRAEFDTLLDGRQADTVVHQCGSGVTACHNLLAMEVAGLPGSRLYPGSWSEWCSDPARPVAIGPEPGGQP